MAVLLMTEMLKNEFFFDVGPLCPLPPDHYVTYRYDDAILLGILLEQISVTPI
jgi:hypothetical protein